MLSGSPKFYLAPGAARSDTARWFPADSTNESSVLSPFLWTISKPVSYRFFGFFHEQFPKPPVLAKRPKNSSSVWRPVFRQTLVRCTGIFVRFLGRLVLLASARSSAIIYCYTILSGFLRFTYEIGETRSSRTLLLPVELQTRRTNAPNRTNWEIVFDHIFFRNVRRRKRILTMFCSHNTCCRTVKRFVRAFRTEIKCHFFT